MESTVGHSVSTRPLRVLLIDDSPDDRALALREIERSLGEVEATEVGGPEALDRAIACDGFDLVITDYRLRWTDGVEILRKVKHRWPDCAVVMFTATGTEQLAVEAMKGGLDDYVLKSSRGGLRLGVAARTSIERVRANSERRQIEERLRLEHAALAAAANGVVIADRDGRIVWANDAFLRLTGYAIDEVLGQNPRILKSGQHDASFYKGLWDTIRSGEVWHGEIVNRRKNGTLYREEMTITPVCGSGGPISNYIAIKQDVTERVHLQEMLLLSEKMDTLGRLAGGLAHDFNNLLQVIRGYVESLLRVTGPEDPRHRALTEMDLAGQRASALIDQLLAFGRSRTMERDSLSLNDIVEDLAPILDRIVGKGVRMNRLLHPGLGPVSADRGQIEQVLLNLVLNARQATPDGGQLTVSTSPSRLSAAEVPDFPGTAVTEFACLSVSDTGCGMDEGTRSRMFDPFFTTKEPGRGTGLGLPVVYGVLKQHGGWFDVESEVGRGTCVKAYLPMLGAHPGADAPKAEDHRRSGVPPGTRILLVDDSARVRAAATRFAATIACDFSAVATGREALVKAASADGRPDVVVVDTRLPDMEGPTLIDGLRGLGPGPAMIVTSGYADASIRWPMISEAGLSFLLKPYSPDLLFEAIVAALSRQ